LEHNNYSLTVCRVGRVSDEFGQFLLSAVVLTVGLFLVAALVAPPDPYTLGVVTLAGVPVVLAGSYVLAYRRGFEWV